MPWQLPLGPRSLRGWFLLIVVLGLVFALITANCRRPSERSRGVLTMGELCEREAGTFEIYAEECRRRDYADFDWAATDERTDALKSVFDGPTPNRRESWLEQARYFDALALKARARARYFGDRVP